MYEIYAVIGAVLMITGVISSSYFIIHTKKNKYRKWHIEKLSDSLGALILGIFYIYCYPIFNENMEYTPTLTFQEIDGTYLNVSDEVPFNFDDITISSTIYSNNPIITTTDKYDSIEGYNTVQAPIRTNFSSTTEIQTPEYQSGTSTYGTTYHTNDDSTVTTEYFPQITPQNISIYQSYFENILRKKLTDTKFANGTIFYNNKEYTNPENKTKLRIKRSSKNRHNSSKQCFKKLFLRHALLVCSFLYSAICLVNNTGLCYKLKLESKHRDSINESPKLNDEEKISSETKNTINDELFFMKSHAESKEEVDNTNQPNTNVKLKPSLDIFLARSSKSTTSTIDIKAISKEIQGNNKYPNYLYQILKLFLIWSSPGFCIYTLHMMMGDPSSTLNPALMTQHNFNITQANVEMLELINNPLKAKTHEKTSEIDSIIKNVYNIVGKTSEQTKSVDGLIYDIIHHLNRKFQQVDVEKCNINSIILKVHSSLLFCIVYLASIFYSIILQNRMKNTGNENTNLLKLNVILFTFIWLPCIVELFLRIYIFDGKPSSAFSATLAIGNIYVVMNNFNNYLLNKKMRKINVDANL